MRTMEELMKSGVNQADALEQLALICNKAAETWWIDINTACPNSRGLTVSEHQSESPKCGDCDGLGYARKDRNVGELLMLAVSELAEAMEGHRKGKMDDKLPHRPMFEVEVADCLIRIFDLAAGLRNPKTGGRYDVGGAFVEKMEFNARREDHTIAHRLGEGGKKY